MKFVWAFCPFIAVTALRPAGPEAAREVTTPLVVAGGPEVSRGTMPCWWISHGSCVPRLRVVTTTSADSPSRRCSALSCSPLTGQREGEDVPVEAMRTEATREQP